MWAGIKGFFIAHPATEAVGSDSPRTAGLFFAGEELAAPGAGRFGGTRVALRIAQALAGGCDHRRIVNPDGPASPGPGSAFPEDPAQEIAAPPREMVTGFQFQQAVVLCQPLAASDRTDFDLTGAGGGGEVG